MIRAARVLFGLAVLAGGWVAAVKTSRMIHDARCECLMLMEMLKGAGR